MEQTDMVLTDADYAETHRRRRNPMTDEEKAVYRARRKLADDARSNAIVYLDLVVKNQNLPAELRVQAATALLEY